MSKKCNDSVCNHNWLSLVQAQSVRHIGTSILFTKPMLVFLCLCSWLLEEKSTSTRTNAIYSLAIIAEQQQQQHYQVDKTKQQQQQEEKQQHGVQSKQQQAAGDQTSHQQPHTAGSQQWRRQERQQEQQQQQQQQQQQEQQQLHDCGVISWRSVVLVTNPFHQLRSYMVFKRAVQEAGLQLQVREGGWTGGGGG